MLSPAKALAETLAKNRPVLIRDVLQNPLEFTPFWFANRRYTFYNQILLSAQMKRRRIPLGPVNGFNTWKTMGNPVAAGQQALYVIAPRDEETTTERMRFQLTPVFALAQTGNPQTVIPYTPLSGVDASKFGYSGPLQTIDDWFSFVYSLIPHQQRANFEYEATLITLLVLISFAGPLVEQSTNLQPFLQGVKKYLDQGLLPKESKVLQEVQRILNSLFG